MATIVIPQNRIRQGSLNGNLVNNNRIDNVTIDNDNISIIPNSSSDGSPHYDLFVTGTTLGANPTSSGYNWDDRNVTTLDTTNTKIEEYIAVSDLGDYKVCYQLCTLVGTLNEYIAFLSDLEPAYRINAKKVSSDVVISGEFVMYDDIDTVKTLIDAQTIDGSEKSIFFGGLKNYGISDSGYDFQGTFTFVVAIPVYYYALVVGEQSALRITEWYGNIVTSGNCYKLNNTTTMTYGSGTKPYTYTSNELIQGDTKITVSTIVTPISEYISDTILEKYAKGQQTLSFTAIYGTYYDTAGNLVYSGTNGQTLKLGDIIEIRGINNVSIALTPTGTAKTFRITSAEYEWNGTNNIYVECVQVV